MDWDLYFFKMVNLVARKSKDPSSKVGSVVVRDNRVLTSGYNGFCVGVTDSPERYNNRKLKYSFIAHSEFNACIIGAKFGISLDGAVLYTHSIPCRECSKAIIQSGIRRVNTLKRCDEIWETYQKKWKSSIKTSFIMLKEAGVDVFESNIFCNEEVLIGGKIYVI